MRSMFRYHVQKPCRWFILSARQLLIGTARANNFDESVSPYHPPCSEIDLKMHAAALLVTHVDVSEPR